MFAPLGNITEDAATGSAAATLGALLIKCTSAPQEFAICQGDDMGRPSRIEVSAEAAQVTIGGSAVAGDAGAAVVNDRRGQFGVLLSA